MPETKSPSLAFNPLLPEYRQDPHPFLHQLRREAPVHHSPLLGVWVLTRYADVLAALRDERFSASSRHWRDHDRYFLRESAGETALLAETYGKWMLQLDPPDHTRLRALVNRAFTPRIVEALAPQIQEAVDRMLDRVLPSGRMDFVADLAYPLPILIISQLMGIPREDHEKIRRWSSALLPSFSPAMSAAQARHVSDAIGAFNDYFRHLARLRREQPGHDLLTSLLQARELEDRLSESELLAACILLAFAGHASTAQLIAGGMLALIEHDDAMEDLRRDPGKLSCAVEESLRFVSPLQLVYRTTREPVKIDQIEIPPGEMVFLSLAAANRDPVQFADPDRFDLSRSENRHIAFGYGIHYCAGAPLARLEARIVFGTILRRMQRIELDAPPQREPSLMLRGLSSLEIQFRTS